MNNSPRQFWNFSCLACERETRNTKSVVYVTRPSQGSYHCSWVGTLNRGPTGEGVYWNSQQKWYAKEECSKECGMSELHFYEWLFLLSPDCVKHSTLYRGNSSVNLKTHNTGEEVPQDWRTGVLKTPNDCRWNAKILVWLLHGYQQHFRFLNEGWCDHMTTHFEKMTRDIK